MSLTQEQIADLQESTAVYVGRMVLYDANGNIVSTIASMMDGSELFGGVAFSFTGNVLLAAAKSAAVAVLAPSVGEWPRWQISYHWTAGSTKTATLTPIYQDAEDDWHQLGALTVKDSFAAGDIESQLIDIIAGKGAKKIGFMLSDYTDGTLNVKVRGVA